MTSCMVKNIEDHESTAMVHIACVYLGHDKGQENITRMKIADNFSCSDLLDLKGKPLDLMGPTVAEAIMVSGAFYGMHAFDHILRTELYNSHGIGFYKATCRLDRNDVDGLATAAGYAVAYEFMTMYSLKMTNEIKDKWKIMSLYSYHDEFHTEF